MTEGHKHRTVRVKRDGLVHRVLKTRLFITTDIGRVDRSPYPYGPMPCPAGCHDDVFWYLSLLGFLHRWTGLTLVVPDPEEE